MKKVSNAAASTRETIFAQASGQGRAGVAIVRVSGPQANTALQALTGKEMPAPRTAVVRTLFDILNKDKIDTALILRFPAPASYTGEDIVEFHIHGGAAVTTALLTALGALPGLRLAAPGEFSRRAVENGRMDLTQAEGIADLVNAETEAQRRQALRQMEGRLGQLCEDWRSRLIGAVAWLEASLDFPDEEIPPGATAEAMEQLRVIARGMRAHLADNRRGEILREGFHVALIGPPNVGKSALMNALAKRDVAIVSDIAGTTRDIIETRLDLGGYPVVLADMAGLRETADAIEEEGVRRARMRAEAADLRILVLDGAVSGPTPPPAEADLTVWNKADLVAARDSSKLWVSACTGEGLEALVERIAEAARGGLEGQEEPALTRARHREALSEAINAIDAALSEDFSSSELVAEHVRRAASSLGRITGHVGVEDILDAVFRDFCIGK